ncbi:MAG: 50S ribosomal protein L15 [Patescibacteria group bacterium]
MPLTLSNLKPAKGSTKKRKLVGRGGKRGTYSGRGIKGQKARSGVSGLKALGFRQTRQRIPKLRGFRSLKPKMAIINLIDLENKFIDNDKVDAKKLIKAGLIESIKGGIKILGEGKLTKKLVVEAEAFSESAKKAIEAVGGQAIVKTKKTKDKKN